MKLLGISGTILGSKTRASIDQLLGLVKEMNPSIETEVIDLRDYNVEFCDGRSFEQYNEDTKTIIEKVKQADFFVIGSPVFQASIPGPLKNLFDLLPTDIFKEKVVGLLMNGGSQHHYLTMENQLRPIVSYLKAYIVPNNVYLHTSDFDSNNLVFEQDMLERLNNLANELVYMATNLQKNAKE